MKVNGHESQYHTKFEVNAVSILDFTINNRIITKERAFSETNNLHVKFLICIENEKMKNLKT